MALSKLDEDVSTSLYDSTRITLWHTMTRRGWIDEAPLLGENYSMRHVDSTRTTQRGWLDKKMTRRGRLREDHSTKADARWFDETTLSHNQESIPKVVRLVFEGHLFCELCDDFLLLLLLLLLLLFQSFEMFSLWPIHWSYYYRNISFSIIILSAFLPANFVTWMIMVLMVFSILFQDHEFNATNCTHKHSCAFSPCVQIYFSAF